MAKRLTILGIETSCDETAAAVVQLDDNHAATLSSQVYSQTAEHAQYGGVVPELAARSHISRLDKLVEKAMAEAGLSFGELDGIAATTGPGLVGGLLVGAMTAKAIAMSHNLDFVGVNHLEGHALTPGLTQNLAPPYLLLLVSGGHTQIVSVEGFNDYHRYGTTIDDALGEAFDKTAKLLNLGYPGGPAVEKAAKHGDQDRFDFPRPLHGKPGCNFSFSGLKTAVRQKTRDLPIVCEQDVADICAGFQKAVTETLSDRLTKAMDRFIAEKHRETPTLVVAGGVAANLEVRSSLEKLCQQKNFALVVPPVHLCTDNAAMIAYVGGLHIKAGNVDKLNVSVRARWPLDPHGEPMPFAGAKA